MIQTCTAQMPTNNCSNRSRKRAGLTIIDNRKGYVLMEMILVIVILGLMATIAGLKLLPAFGRSMFKKEAQEIVSALVMAQNAAAQSNRKYAVLFDLIEQSYTLQEINAVEDLGVDAEPDPEMVLATKMLTERCRIDYIRFDDGDDTRNEGVDLADLRSYFVAGRNGWQNGGKIVMLDNDGKPCTIVINRLSKMITMVEGEEDIYVLEAIKDLPF
ncbi:MAG: prepilin-type N-terminal cleavage/methylation domain-containing protein [Planctomycetes bacterium]|nr:prepilin-type N-terminal cleavage/methylation domain-containing protein [Planctomycetota bacterium]